MNKISSFILIKYLIYFLQFLLLFLIPLKFGFELFAIYSFLKIIFQYFSYSNIGINYSFNILISKSKNLKRHYLNSLLSNTLLLNFIYSLFAGLIIILLSNFFNLNFLLRFDFDRYAIISVILFFLKQNNAILVNYERFECRLLWDTALTRGLHFNFYVSPEFWNYISS